MSIPPVEDSTIISSDKKHEILSMSPDEFTVEYILKGLGLGEFSGREKSIDFNDIVVLEPGDYTGIESETESTVGKLLINQVLFSPLSIDFEYQNETFTEDHMEYLLNYIGSKVLSKDLPIEEYKKLLSRFEDFGLRLSSVVSPSVYMDMLQPDEEITDLRDELIEEHREEIENGNTEILQEIEDKLIEKVEEVYADNPQMQLYLSGGKPYLDGSYKTSSLMVGAIPADINSSEFHITTNNYVDGLDKDDIHKVSSSMILGAYFRASGNLAV